MGVGSAVIRMKCNSILVALALLSPAFDPTLIAASESSAVKRLFAEPPREYATAPLWVWNDRLTEAQVRGTLRDLAGQRVNQVFVHPRPGLMTPYLSEEWFRLWKIALDEAERLDMNVWIYDENSYPSGFAGGWVPELMPSARGLGLKLVETKAAPAWHEQILKVLQVQDDAYTRTEDITASLKEGRSLPEGRYFVASVQEAGNSPWHGNRWYVNLLTPGVTETFIEVTLEAYRTNIGEHFGKRVPGVFTDEPNICPAGGLPWARDLPEQFEQRWGYCLVDQLPSLVLEVGDWRRVRHNYFQTLLDLFIERWAKPMYDWCGTNGLEFTGHYWDHEWPRCIGVPDNMAMAAWQHRPGVDTLMNQYAEHTHAQFGNVRYCREVSSIANQLGRKRTLVELYGAGGWDLRFVDMKRIGDWLQVLGLNTLDQHLSYITLRGARKRDHPQSFSYHEPWWEAYHLSAAYFARLSAALSQGDQYNRLLVIEPTTTAWMYQGNEARLKEIGDSFSNLLMALEAAQIEYDLGCEDVLARHGQPVGETVAVAAPAHRVLHKELRVGQRTYHTVVLPPALENLNAATARLFDQVTCVRAYGRAESPRIDGQERTSSVPERGMDRAALDRYPARIAAELAHCLPSDGFALHRDDGDRGILFHHRRQLDDGELVFLVNTSLEHPARGTLISDRQGIERWNLDTGAVEPYAFVKGSGVTARFDLPPAGSLLLFLSRASRSPETKVWGAPLPVPAAGPIEVARLEPNVLTLDYVDVTAGGESRTNVYFYQANRFAWQKHGMDRNPWDSAVQFKDELIARTFPSDSGFRASYRFVIGGAVPSDLTIVIERPDLYQITCNGHPVKARAGAWWLDRAFGRIEIDAVARVGENVVTLEASPFTMNHEIEPAYLRGAFALEPAACGFSVVPEQPLHLKDGAGWNDQGHPFYSAGVAYRQEFCVDSKAPRSFIRLGRWNGSVARVRVNGDLAGYISAPPWELDVTAELITGVNRVEVTVFGTLKNTLGPHHNNPPLGSAWPAMFHAAPEQGPPRGGYYQTVGYGLFEPFALLQSSPL